MIMHFWPDQSWFCEIMWLATDTLMFPALRVAVVEHNNGEAVPKDMRDITLTAWKHTSQSAPEMVLQRKLQEKSLTLR